MPESVSVFPTETPDWHSRRFAARSPVEAGSDGMTVWLPRGDPALLF